MKIKKIFILILIILFIIYNFFISYNIEFFNQDSEEQIFYNELLFDSNEEHLEIFRDLKIENYIPYNIFKDEKDKIKSLLFNKNPIIKKDDIYRIVNANDFIYYLKYIMSRKEDLKNKFIDKNFIEYNNNFIEYNNNFSIKDKDIDIDTAIFKKCSTTEECNKIFNGNNNIFKMKDHKKDLLKKINPNLYSEKIWDKKYQIYTIDYIKSLDVDKVGSDLLDEYENPNNYNDSALWFILKYIIRSNIYNFLKQNNINKFFEHCNFCHANNFITNEDYVRNMFFLPEYSISIGKKPHDDRINRKNENYNLVNELLPETDNILFNYFRNEIEKFDKEKYIESFIEEKNFLKDKLFDKKYKYFMNTFDINDNFHSLISFNVDKNDIKKDLIEKDRKYYEYKFNFKFIFLIRNDQNLVFNLNENGKQEKLERTFKSFMNLPYNSNILENLINKYYTNDLRKLLINELIFLNYEKNVEYPPNRIYDLYLFLGIKDISNYRKYIVFLQMLAFNKSIGNESLLIFDFFNSNIKDKIYNQNYILTNNDGSPSSESGGFSIKEKLFINLIEQEYITLSKKYKLLLNKINLINLKDENLTKINFNEIYGDKIGLRSNLNDTDNFIKDDTKIYLFYLKEDEKNYDELFNTNQKKLDKIYNLINKKITNNNHITINCVDDDGHCPIWAKSGECEKNPGYMSFNCRKSCNTCDGQLISNKQPSINEQLSKNNQSISNEQLSSSEQSSNSKQLSKNNQSISNEQLIGNKQPSNNKKNSNQDDFIGDMLIEGFSSCKDKNFLNGSKWIDNDVDNDVDNSLIYNCEDYKNNKLCANRDITNEYISRKKNALGIDAKEACCVCGGGISFCPGPSCSDNKPKPGKNTVKTDFCPGPSCSDNKPNPGKNTVKTDFCPSPSCSDNKPNPGKNTVKTDFFIINMPSTEFLKQINDTIKEILKIDKEIKFEINKDEIIFTIQGMKLSDLKNQDIDTIKTRLRYIIFMRLKEINLDYENKQIDISFKSGSVKIIVKLLSLEEAYKKQSTLESSHKNGGSNLIQFKPKGKNGIFYPVTKIGGYDNLNEEYKQSTEVSGMTLN